MNAIIASTTRRAVRIGVIGLCVAGLLIMGDRTARCADPSCEELRLELARMRADLDVYLDSITEFRRQGDLRLVSIVGAKIGDLAADIAEIERSADCPMPQPDMRLVGVSPVKTDAGRYVAVGCAELRMKLVTALQRLNGLERIRHAVFSRSEPNDREELRAAREEVETIKSVLRARCSPRLRTVSENRPR